jgi:hypothetical protein
VTSEPGKGSVFTVRLPGEPDMIKFFGADSRGAAGWGA